MMQKLLSRAALAAAMMAAGVGYAAAQAGPADSKGQGGATQHRGVADPSGGKQTERNNEQVRADGTGMGAASTTPTTTAPSTASPAAAAGDSQSPGSHSNAPNK